MTFTERPPSQRRRPRLGMNSMYHITRQSGRDDRVGKLQDMHGDKEEVALASHYHHMDSPWTEHKSWLI